MFHSNTDMKNLSFFSFLLSGQQDKSIMSKLLTVKAILTSQYDNPTSWLYR